MKKATEQFSKRHIQIFDADWEYLLREFGDTIGAGPAIRHIVRKAVKALRERSTPPKGPSGTKGEENA